MNSDKRPRGILKESSDCFVVQELIGSSVEPVPLLDESSVRGWEGSPVTLFDLTKENWNTEDAVREVARQLGVLRSNISLYGLKDKRALTSQRIGVSGKFEPNFEHPEIFLHQREGSNWPLRIGGNRGNRFSIFIVTEADSIRLDEARRVPNLFGKQRMGRSGSEVVGRLILEGDYEEAAHTILVLPKGNALLRIRDASWKEALLHPEFQHDLEFNIERWQSFLWNALLKEHFGNGLPPRLAVWGPDPKIRTAYQHLWNPATLDADALRFVHQWSRLTMVEPANLRAGRKPRGWEICFDLPPGCYATVILEQLFDLVEPHRS